MNSGKMHNHIQPLLDISSVDFENVGEINCFAGNLINLGNSIGVVAGTARLQTEDAMAIYQIAKEWVDTVKMRLRSMSPADAVRVIDAYEIMYRIANRTSVKPDEIDRVKLTVFDAMIRGDRNVDEYIMFRLIRKAVCQRKKAFLDKPLKWSCLREDQWYKEAKAGFYRIKLSDYDILNRASILLESDLYAFEGSQQLNFKRKLFNSTRHYLDNYDATDPQTQFAIEQYLYASAKFLTAEELERYRNTLKEKRVK